MDPSQVLSAPQATLMTTIAQGIFSGNLEWTYICVGIGLGAVVIVADRVLRKSTDGRWGLPALAVGMGIYLPPSVNMPIVAGAVLAWLVSRHLAKKGRGFDEKAAADMKAGAERRITLFSAGLIVGESLIGVILAFVIAASVTSGGSDAPLSVRPANWDTPAEILGLLAFIGGAAILVRRVLRQPAK